MYSNVLDTLEHGPLKNMCSPWLMGSSGIIPMSIISLYALVMLVNCMSAKGGGPSASLISCVTTRTSSSTHNTKSSLRPTTGSRLGARTCKLFNLSIFPPDLTCPSSIHDALIELSRRSLSRPPEDRPVVKLIFDRGNPKQLIKNHQLVAPDDWAGLGLPAKEELEGIHFEVMVRPPCPPARRTLRSLGSSVQNYHRPVMGTFHAKYLVIDRRLACVSSNNIQDRVNLELNIHLEGPIVNAFYDMALLSWGEKMSPPLPLLADPSRVDLTSRFRGVQEQREGREGDKPGSGGDAGPRDAFEEAALRKQDMIDKAADALPTHPETPNPQDGDANPMERAPGEHTEGVQGEAEPTHNPIKKEEEKRKKKKDAEKQKPMTDFTLIQAEGFKPFVLHERHEPVPIAMVNRAPHGSAYLFSVLHICVYADRSPLQHRAMRMLMSLRTLLGSQESDSRKRACSCTPASIETVAICSSSNSQTPDFNAPEVVEAILDACRRDVVCTLYICLGYNDQGEMLPMQGGTNSKVFATMCAALNKEGQGKRKNLKACWYVAKDRELPTDASKKERNCHGAFSPAQLTLSNADTLTAWCSEVLLHRRAGRHRRQREPGRAVVVPLAGGQRHGRLAAARARVARRAEPQPELGHLRRGAGGWRLARQGRERGAEQRRVRCVLVLSVRAEWWLMSPGCRWAVERGEGHDECCGSCAGQGWILSPCLVCLRYYEISQGTRKHLVVQVYVICCTITREYEWRVSL